MQRDLLARIESADLDALEAVRVTALGKQGSITALLKSLGKMSPDERQAEGPRIHALREAVTQAIATRKDALERVALDARLAAETDRSHDDCEQNDSHNPFTDRGAARRSEEHTSDLQTLMRITSAVLCSKRKNNTDKIH